MPQVKAKTHSSKLFHSELVKNILLEEVTEIQIRKDFKHEQLIKGTPFKEFKKSWLAKR